MTKPRNLVSPAEYARIRGTSKQSVSRAIHANRIPTVDGPRGRRLIDVDAANVAWASRTDITSSLRGSPEQLANSQALARTSTSKAKPVDGQKRAAKHASNLIEEKTKAERLRIERAEIELAVLRGSVVNKAAVEAALSAKLIVARDTLEAIPERFAAIFAAEADANAIHRTLSREINLALSQIAAVPAGLQ